MPGYTIKGFEFSLDDEPFVTQQLKEHYQTYGWVGDDGLHCRTRAVWNPAMVFITTKTIEPEVDAKHKNVVCTTIIDYSKKGLVKEKCNLFWRVFGDKNWNRIALNQIENTDHFFSEIPYHTPGAKLEYYIYAVSNSGDIEARPRTAPLGTYRFAIK